MAQHIALVPAGNERSLAHSIFLAQLVSVARGMKKYEDFMQSMFYVCCFYWFALLDLCMTAISFVSG